MLALPDCRVVRVPAQDAGAASTAQRLPAARGVVNVFTPSKDDVRRFFCETWRKHHDGRDADSDRNDGARLDHRASRNTTTLFRARRRQPRSIASTRAAPIPSCICRCTWRLPSSCRSISPPGIRAAYQRLVARRSDAHAAAHEVMECLGEVIWSAQRAGDALPPDEMSARYLECLERRASQYLSFNRPRQAGHATSACRCRAAPAGGRCRPRRSECPHASAAWPAPP